MIFGRLYNRHGKPRLHQDIDRTKTRVKKEKRERKTRLCRQQQQFTRGDRLLNVSAATAAGLI